MSPDILIDTGTFIHPAIVVLIIVSCILIPVINIRYSIFLMVLLSIIIPKTQRISIFTLNFNIIRLILLTGWIKIIFNKELKLVKTEKIDKTIIYYVMVSSIVYVIQQSNLNAVIHMLGFSYDVIGTYFLYRIIIKRKEDISTIINSLAIVSVILAIFMFYEQWTGKNWFYVIGAENKFTPARMGLLRSSGPFGHAITAGLFGATMIPLCFSMWRHKWGSPFFGFVGMLSACIVIYILINDLSCSWSFRNYCSLVLAVKESYAHSAIRDPFYCSCSPNYYGISALGTYKTNGLYQRGIG